MNPQDSQIHFWAVSSWSWADSRVARPWGSTNRDLARSSTPAPPTTPREAATVIVLRGGGERARGAARQAQPRAAVHGRRVGVPRRRGRRRTRTAASRACARWPRRPRVALPDAEALVEFSRWITPARGEDPLRHALLPRWRRRRTPSRGSTAAECVDIGWFSPAGALEAYERERDPARVPDHQDARAARRRSRPPTSCSSWAAGREVVPIEPRVVMEGEVARVVAAGRAGVRGMRPRDDRRSTRAARPRGRCRRRSCSRPNFRTTATRARRASPTWEALESAIGALEGGESIAFSSGMAAVSAVLEPLPVGARVVGPAVGYTGVRAAARASAPRPAGSSSRRSTSTDTDGDAARRATARRCCGSRRRPTR